MVWGNERTSVVDSDSIKPRDRGSVPSSTKGGRKEFFGEFHSYRKPSIGSGSNQKSYIIEGYPKGSIINLTGVAKSGKTTYALQEAFFHAKSGADVLYVYNESPEFRFMSVVGRHMQMMGFKEEDIKTLQFLNLFSVNLGSAQYHVIESWMDRIFSKKIGEWIERSKNPELIVIDSMSKPLRQYTAQVFYAVQCFTRTMWDYLEKSKKRPVIMMINQKSGSMSWEKDNESVVGGMGVLHDCDGSVILGVDVSLTNWDVKATGVRLGKSYHWIQVTDMRDVDVCTDRRFLVKKDGRLSVGKIVGVASFGEME